MVPLTQIIDKIRQHHSDTAVEFVNRAYAYSARMHDGQRRKSGDPYFVHPVSVADIIADMRLDPASVCAALLHDVIEDTEATEEEVCAQFGKEVAFLVSGVTKLGKLNFDTREDRQVESFRKMLVEMSADIRVLLLKLAARLDNCLRRSDFVSRADSVQDTVARLGGDEFIVLLTRIQSAHDSARVASRILE